MKGKQAIKALLGELPLSAEVYMSLRPKGKALRTRFSLEHLRRHLPEVTLQAQSAALQIGNGKKILIFATLHYWVEQAALLGISLAGMGYAPHLAYLPYFDWQKPVDKFDLRRNNLYARDVLAAARSLLASTSLLDYPNSKKLPPSLERDMELVSHYDAQYTLQVETVDTGSDIFRLRLERNRFAAEKLLALVEEMRPDAVIVPNGTIQELGVAYRVARYLGIPVSTYEFSDQRDSIWLAQDDEIMRQDTRSMWSARGETPLTADQRERIEGYYRAKMQGDLFGNFVRQWQSSRRAGSEQARQQLGLDDRPIVLLATNVLGDSLTLGRQVFSQTMAEWIERTVQYLAQRKDAQLIIRVHPGEVLTHGPSMVDVVNVALPGLPENIHLVGPRDKVNTYDLVELADLGLVYTTTTGLEMALAGVPVVAAGDTHYKGKGFTQDPQTYPEYFQLLDKILADPGKFRLNTGQVDAAWRYAYRFFFEYSLPFPWRLVQLWEDVKERPVSYVLGEGLPKYEATFRSLAGEKIEW